MLTMFWFDKIYILFINHHFEILVAILEYGSCQRDQFQHAKTLESRFLTINHTIFVESR